MVRRLTEFLLLASGHAKKTTEKRDGEKEGRFHPRKALGIQSLQFLNKGMRKKKPREVSFPVLFQVIVVFFTHHDAISDDMLGNPEHGTGRKRGGMEPGQQADGMQHPVSDRGIDHCLKWNFCSFPSLLGVKPPSEAEVGGGK